MKLSRKMTLRFIRYFLTFYGVLFIGTAVMFALFVYKMMIGFYFHDIRALEQGEMKWAVKYKNGSVMLTDSLLDIAERSGGIVQLVNEEGKVRASSKDGVLPLSYELEDLTSLVGGKGIYTWFLEDGSILIFQEYTETDDILTNLQRKPSFPELSADDVALLDMKGATFELFDNKGSLLYSTAPSQDKRLEAGDLLKAARFVNERTELLSFTTLPDGQLAMVRMENPYYHALESIDLKLLKSFVTWFVGYHLILLLFTLGFSLWIGREFGKPIFYFLEWMERLSKKEYKRPVDRKIRSGKNDRLKRRYRIYEEVDTSLARLSTNLQDNERTIHRTEQLREDWISGLSHDLKTPLSSIFGYAAMLKSEHQWTPAEVKAFANTMMEKAGYMDALINDLTYTYQLKNDGVLLEKQVLPLFEYIYAYMDRRDWQNPFLLEGDKEGSVAIDPSRFERVLDNVIGNAITHNPPKTAIHLQLSTCLDTVELFVRDDGKGIPDEVMENLFNRYYRGTNTTTDESGTGLGLTIAKQLIEAHGGEVEASSSSKGTAILIRLPRHLE